MDHAQNPQLRPEKFAQLGGQLRLGVEVQLHAGQAALANGGDDLLQRGIDEDADLFDACRKVRHDGRYLGRRHAARAGREDKAHCVGSGFDGQLRVLERSVAADFDPETHEITSP